VEPAGPKSGHEANRLILNDFKPAFSQLGRLNPAQKSQLHNNPLRNFKLMINRLENNQTEPVPRHLNVNIQEAYAMLQIDIERLPSYQKGLEKGMERGMEKGMEKGMEEGEHRKALAVARELLAMNFSPEQVAAITQLPLAEIPKK
jgi:predicted transposase/invertase (TIGR01784 family)